MVFNNPTDRPSSYYQSDNTIAPNIVRLVEDPTVEKTIRFDELSIDDTPDPTDVQGGNKKIDAWGLQFPAIRINDAIISYRNLSSVKISMSGFFPTISVRLIYEDNSFVSKNMPKDGDMISLFLRTSTDAIQYIRADFIITSCSSSTGSAANPESNITINGKLFVPGMDSTQETWGYTGTSREVIRKVAQTYGLGFSFNDYDDTDDYQNWIRCRETAQNFINGIVTHSWKNNTSFYKAWIDLYYDLCFVNVNKFLLSTENDEEIDITFASNIIDMYNQIDLDTSVDKSMITVKLLTNMSNMRGSPFYIKKWTPINASTSVSFNVGYMTTTYSYLHNQKLISGNDENCFTRLEMIPAYDQNKTETSILLRGRSKYEKGKNPDNEKARVNYDFVNTYNRDEWIGIQYTLSDDDKGKDPMEWSGNVHKNYSNAEYHNRQNLAELNKMYLRVECEGLNLQIMKGERIPVVLIPTTTIEQESMDKFSKNDKPSEINRLYSGYYIVDSIDYDYNPVYKGQTPYKTTFILKLREWPTPEKI